MRRAGLTGALVVACSLVGPAPVRADTTLYASSQEAAPLYGRLASARSAALGGAFSAVIQGEDALFGSPAGLAEADHLGVGVHYQSWLADVSDETVYATEGLGRGLGLGVYGHLTDYGSFQLRDDNGQRTGDAEARDLAFGLALGANLGAFDVGIAGRAVRQDLVGEQAWGLAMDLGVAWSHDGTRLGLAAVNVGTAIDGSQGAESLRLGASQRFDFGGAALRPGLGVQWEPQGMSHVQAGVELQLNHALALRGGYDQSLGDTLLDGLQGFTLGLGFKLGSVGIDFAYISFGGLGAGQRISVSWQGGVRAPARLAGVSPSAAVAVEATGPPPASDPLALPRQLVRDGRLGEALAELQRLSVERSHEGAVWRELGQLQWRLGQKSQALDSLRLAQSLAPDPSLGNWIHQADTLLSPPTQP